MSALDAASSPSPRAFTRARVSSRAVGVGVVLAIFALVYAALALYQPLPIIFPDEFIYGHLARSVAHGGGFTWRGDSVDLRAAGYVFAIAPAWLLGSGVKAYQIAKIEGAVFCCLTGVPVWLMARAVLERRLALAAVVLSVSGTWMVTTAGLLTENLALPLATGALAAAVHALRRPGSRAGWIAVALALLAVYCRMQLFVLLPALAITFIVDGLTDREHRTERLASHRVPLAVLGGAALLFVLLAAVDGHAVTGLYSNVLHYHPSVGRIIGKSGLQLAQFAVMSGFVPLLVIVAAACNGAAWHDRAVGPLLLAFVPATALLVLESGFFLAANAPWGIERYVEYTVPLALVLALAIATRPALLRRSALIGAGALTLLLLFLPKLGNATEERAVSATFIRVRALLGSMSPASATFIAAVAVVGFVGALVYFGRRRWGTQGAVLAGAAALFLVLVAQSATAWSLQLNLSRDWRSSFASDPQWVDHHTAGRTAVLAVTANALGFEDIDFFNPHIAAYYAPPSASLPGRVVLGRRCTWSVRADGRLTFEPRCGPTPHEFFVNDPAAIMRFRNEVASTTDPHVGRVVRVAGAPQLTGLIATPCNRPRVRFVPPLERTVPATAPAACAPVLIAETWVQQPGMLRLTFRGGAGPHSVVLGTRRYAVPPRKLTTISVPLKAGPAALQFQLDWSRRSAVDPAFVRGRIDAGGESSVLG